MATKQYLELTDVKNRHWKKLISSDPTILQEYLDAGDNEIEDIAKREGVEIADILDPIHFKLKQYIVQFVLKEFASDRVGFNVRVGEKDIYKDLFEQSIYLMNVYKPDITPSVLTGKYETKENRSVSFGELKRG